MLARALCATKKLLILDEPVTGLDPKVTVEMYRLIQALNQNEGITVVMISHDMEAVKAYASHVLYLGRDRYYGTKQEFLKSAVGKRFSQKGDAE